MAQQQKAQAGWLGRKREKKREKAQRRAQRAAEQRAHEGAGAARRAGSDSMGPA
jgi:hypothetical protein